MSVTAKLPLKPTNFTDLNKKINKKKQSSSHPRVVKKSIVWVSYSTQLDFKILRITFKACMVLGSGYPGEMLTPYTPVCGLTSYGGAILAVPMLMLKLNLAVP